MSCLGNQHYVPRSCGSALENAAIAMHQATTDGRGLKVYLCNPLDKDAVRRQVRNLAVWFEPDNNFIGNGSELAAVRNLKLLLDVYEQHLLLADRVAAATKPPACKPGSWYGNDALTIVRSHGQPATEEAAPTPQDYLRAGYTAAGQPPESTKGLWATEGQLRVSNERP